MAFVGVVAVVPNQHCGVTGDMLVVAAAYDHGFWGVAANISVLASQLFNCVVSLRFKFTTNFSESMVSGELQRLHNFSSLILPTAWAKSV